MNSPVTAPFSVVYNDRGPLTSSSWSNATVISDSSPPWNNDNSYNPSMAIDNNGVIHVVWYDESDGEWGTDTEIMYTNYTGSGWSNATVISDKDPWWNNGSSANPSVAVDNNGVIHVVWYDETDGAWGTDTEIMYTNYTGSGWSNATVISDQDPWWNNGNSYNPSMAVDNNGVIHVVWYDDTDGAWGEDKEIMYANYTGSSWSNATVISDDVTGWNNGSSNNPFVAVDNNGVIHVVWYDSTFGAWGEDKEIMYANYTGSGWSNATVISDKDPWWNDGGSYNPSMAVDNNGVIHVVWYDGTDGAWGNDNEIMYANCTGSGWSNATLISDKDPWWNNGDSYEPSVAVDNIGTVHVVWMDETDGAWGTDYEIMYISYTASGWSNATVISDDSTMWNTGSSNSPSIVLDNNGIIHVAWTDNTAGSWGSDREIMYCRSMLASTQPNSGLILLELLQPADSTWIFVLIGICTAVGIVIIVFIFLKRKQ
ncbi:MAG: hypothetical protein ACTSR3_17535 [Candidatus Helarchaeota archaeon]